MDEEKHGKMALASGLQHTAFSTQEDRKSGHRVPAETILFPRTGYGGMILTNLEVIWEMSGKTFSEPYRMAVVPIAARSRAYALGLPRRLVESHPPGPCAVQRAGRHPEGTDEHHVDHVRAGQHQESEDPK